MPLSPAHEKGGTERVIIIFEDSKPPLPNHSSCRSVPTPPVSKGREENSPASSLLTARCAVQHL